MKRVMKSDVHRCVLYLFRVALAPFFRDDFLNRKSIRKVGLFPSPKYAGPGF